MDLTPARQRLLFAVIVLVLVGLGAYIISNRHSGSPAASSTATPTASSAGGSTAPADVPPSVIPSATPVSTAGGAEIYSWLPFTADQLNQAVQTTSDFAVAYATWSYKESEAQYGAQLRDLVTPDELAILEGTYVTPGVAQPRAAGKQVSVSSGTIDRISTFGADPVSITFVVAIDQKVISTGPAVKQNNSYAVTVQLSGGSWQVSDIELQGLGNS
jgi:hypothetical protein